MRDVVDLDAEAAGGDWDFDLPEREALRELSEQRRALDRREDTLVDAARRLAVPWRSIGSDLGIGTTTAYRRHAPHDPIAARRRVLSDERKRPPASEPSESPG